MPSSSFRLGPSQLDDVASICAIGAAGLARANAKLDSSSIIIDRKIVEQALEDSVDAPSARSLGRFVFGIVSYIRQTASSVTDTLDIIESNLQNAVDEERRFEAWPQCRPELTRLLLNTSVRLSVKAFEVSYDFERLYTDGRFITSIRPLFDDNKERILGTTVVQTLRLDFQRDGGETGSYSFAMDKADIEQLKRACEEALKKSAVAFHDVRHVWGIPTIMPGET